jgi:hypothetical protein
MVASGECGYCHTVIPSVGLPSQPSAPQVVHVTKVQLGGPQIHVAGIFDSVMGRVAGCFTGCLSMGFSLALTAFIFGMVAWQLWLQTPRATPPAPTPRVEQPAPAPSPGEKPRRGKQR